MTVADMTPFQIYALLVTANVMTLGGLYCIKMTSEFDLKRQKMIGFGAAAGLIGAPAIYGLGLLHEPFGRALGIY